MSTLGKMSASSGHRSRKLVAATAALVMGVAVFTLFFGDDSSRPPAADATTSVPTTDAAMTAVEAFLEARLAGEGAEAFVAEGVVPLLYATTEGATYERYELVELAIPEWSTGRVFRVRLYTEDNQTVVEQHLELDGAGIHPRQGWWALGSRLVAGTTEDGQPLAALFDWLDFRLYDANDNENSPDDPEVPDTFSSSEWFVGGIFDYVTAEEMATRELDLESASAFVESAEHHLYWRAQGGEWVELPLVQETRRDALAPWGEVLPILRHNYHIFQAGSLAPGVYEWRWEVFGAPEEYGDPNAQGEIHIVP